MPRPTARYRGIQGDKDSDLLLGIAPSVMWFADSSARNAADALSNVRNAIDDYLKIKSRFPRHVVDLPWGGVVQRRS